MGASRVIDISFKSNLHKDLKGEVAIGVFAAAGSELAQKAIVNEFGNLPLIPSRPFIRSTFDMHIGEIENYVEEVFRSYLVGQANNREILEKIGLYIQTLVVRRINSSRSWAVKNSPATIAVKGSDQPLVDTGQLRSNITYKVKL